MTAPPTPATPFTLEHLLDIVIEVEWFDATKEKLSAAAVLTGLLDYGLFADKVPPCFTSEGLAAIASAAMSAVLDETDDKKLANHLDKRAHDYIRYEVLRDINIPRHLGISHPEAYAVQSLAISRHWKEIATHCNQPNPAISRIHVRHTGSGSIFEMKYKGRERYQLEEDEIRWMAGAQYVVHADVASCFPSIYTHSIPWALHGKAASKKSASITALAGNLLAVAQAIAASPLRFDQLIHEYGRWVHLGLAPATCEPRLQTLTICNFNGGYLEGLLDCPP